MAYVKCGRNEDAIKSAKRVIDNPDQAAEGTVVKAHYWRGTAFFNVGEFSSCAKECVAAVKRDKGNKAVRKLYKKATKAAKSAKAKTKKLFGGMFDKVKHSILYVQ